MNFFRQAFSRAASSIPNAAKGGNVPQMPRGGGTAVGMLVALGAGSYGLYHSVVTIQPGHAGLIYNRLTGLDEKVFLKEGLNFVIPWFQRAIVYDIRTRPQPIDTQSGSKGLICAVFEVPMLISMLLRFANGADFTTSSLPS